MENEFIGKKYTIVFEHVSHYCRIDDESPIVVYFKYSKFNTDSQDYEPNIWLNEEDATLFKAAYKKYIDSNQLEKLMSEKLLVAASNMNGLLAKYSLSTPEDQHTISKLSVELADELLKCLYTE